MNEQKTDASEHDPNSPEHVDPVHESTFSRREALRLIIGGAFGVTAIGGAVAAELKSPGFWEKVERAIREGKVLEDIWEVVESRLHLNSGEPRLLDFKEIPYNLRETWMDVVSKDVKLLKFSTSSSAREYSYLLLDVTDTTVAYDNPNASQASLAQLVVQEQCITLPGPQYAIPIDQRVQKNLEYLLYANHDLKDTQSESIPIESKRGGIVLDNSGVLKVVSPEEMAVTMNNAAKAQPAERPRAVMEYAFIIDSQDLDGSFTTLRTAKSGALNLKDLANSVEYMNVVVSMYDRKGTAHTYIFAAFQPQPPAQPTSEGAQIRSMNLLQMASLMEKLQGSLDMARFVIAVPDPSEVAISYVPQKMNTISSDTPNTDSDISLRSLGTIDPYTAIQQNRQAMPWLLASHVKKN